MHIADRIYTRHKQQRIKIKIINRYKFKERKVQMKNLLDSAHALHKYAHQICHIILSREAAEELRKELKRNATLCRDANAE